MSDRLLEINWLAGKPTLAIGSKRCIADLLSISNSRQECGGQQALSITKKIQLPSIHDGVANPFRLKPLKQAQS